jgi:hypothetical protein
MTDKIKHSFTVPFAQISHEIFLDSLLSMKAKGVLCWLISKPNDWDFSVQGMMTQCSDGKKSLDSALKELEKNGYLKREKTRDKNNKFDKTIWHIYQRSNNVSTTPFSARGFSARGKGATSNNNIRKNKEDLLQEEEDLSKPRSKAFNKVIDKWKASGRSQAVIEKVIQAYKEQPPGNVMSIPKWMESVYAQKLESLEVDEVAESRRHFALSRPSNYHIKDDVVTYISGACERKYSLRGDEDFWNSVMKKS